MLTAYYDKSIAQSMRLSTRAQLAANPRGTKPLQARRRRSERERLDLAVRGEEFARVSDRCGLVETLAGVEHDREEPRRGPDVGGDPRVDERQERVEALVFSLPDAGRRVDHRLAVGLEAEVSGDTEE